MPNKLWVMQRLLKAMQLVFLGLYQEPLSPQIILDLLKVWNRLGEGKHDF